MQAEAAFSAKDFFRAASFYAKVSNSTAIFVGNVPFPYNPWVAPYYFQIREVVSPYFRKDLEDWLRDSHVGQKGFLLMARRILLLPRLPSSTKYLNLLPQLKSYKILSSHLLNILWSTSVCIFLTRECILQINYILSFEEITLKFISIGEQVILIIFIFLNL